MSQILLTGANRGLGLELARQLCASGDSVIATARNPDQAAELRALDVRVETLDVGQAESVAALATRLKGVPIDVLINNAGIGVKSVSLDELDVESMTDFFRVNTLGPLRVTQALLPNLRAGQRKLIVHMTSKMGSIEDNGSGGAYAYRASKTALNMVNKSMALDLASEGFVCTVLHPGWVRTDMGGSAAPLGVEQSVAGLLEVIARLGPADNAAFFDYSGARIPW